MDKPNVSERIITGFEPDSVFRFFEEVSRIPRGSGNEKGVADYLTAFAAARGIDCYRDGKQNVLFRLPATPGREGEAPLLLQGHTDMVCEKNGDTVHDFTADPLHLCQNGTRLFAKGTTLGGDDGIAVAILLALADGELSSHPALECLFTTEEETGMGGAMAFDYSRITARHMVNLDSEEEGVITVGCAGGIRTDLQLPVTTVPTVGEVVKVSLTGLCGGHSGECIHKGRANAIQLLGRLLLALDTCNLLSAEGGSKDNAIPREAEAVIAVPSAAKAGMRLLTLADEIAPELVQEDGDCSLRCERPEADEYPVMFDDASTNRVLAVLTNAPGGVLAMSPDGAGLVEYSRNLGILRTEEDGVRMTFSTRSAKDSRLDQSTAALDALATLCGGSARHHSRYPGWDYQKESPLRTAFARAWKRETGKEAKTVVIHAGLECGYMKKQIPDLDIISIGPDMEGIHSPAEVLHLDSVERVWKALATLLTDWHETK